MSVIAEWFRRVAYLLNRSRHDAALRAEMESHRAMMANPARFGNELSMREEARDVWGWRWLDDLAQDVRYGTRALFNSHRTFAVTSLLTLAIGIGATTALFTVVNSVLLRPLPFPEPQRLMAVRLTDPKQDMFALVRRRGLHCFP